MSIIPFVDDLFFPERRSSYYMVPRTSHGYLSNVLNEGFRELQKLERNLGELQTDMSLDPSKGYSFRCSVAGYAPEELKVDVEDDTLVIQGNHQSSGDGQTLQRSFTRRFTLPPDTVKQSIQCNINERGMLEVVAPREQSKEQSKTHNIPIGFKSSQSQQQIENSKKNGHANEQNDAKKSK